MSYPLVDLGSVVELRAGIGFPTRLQGKKSGEFPFAKVGDISRNGRTGNPTLKTVDNFIDQPDVEILRAKLIPTGSILFAKIGEAIRQNHRIISHQDLLIDNNAMAAIPSERISNLYLYYFLKQLDFYRLAPATTVPALRKSDLQKIQVPLPPLAEQLRIASILDQADALRQKRQQAIEKLDQLLQATFIDMFGDPVSNPKGWDLGKLGDVIHSAKDGPHVSPNYSETGIPFLSTRHVRAGKIVWNDLKFITEEDAQIHWKKCKPTRGDILYTKGGTTGLAAVVDTDLDFAVWVHVALLKTNHDKVRYEWLVSMLNTQYCYEQSQRYTHGIANRDLGLKRMVNIEIYIPPLDEQDKFVNFKNKLMKNNLLFENSNSYFKQLFKSLQNQAFNGNL